MSKRRNKRIRLAVAQQWRCYYCRCPLNRSVATIEHVIPLARGGTWDESNLRSACKVCNARKGDMTEEEFRASPRFPRYIPAVRRAIPQLVVAQTPRECEKGWSKEAG